MRTLLFTLLLSGCTAETDLDRFNDLKANVTHDCGSFFVNGRSCASEASARAAVQCLNDALASGERATYDFGSEDTQMFELDTVYFTVDHQVQVYVYQPGPSQFSSGPTASEQRSCTGPFELYTGLCPFSGGMDYGLTLTGCPITPRGAMPAGG